MEGSVSLVGLLCRTSDRTAGAARGVEALAAAVGKRLGVEPRMIGSPAEPRSAPFEDDLRHSRGCLLEAGGQVDDALSGGNVPVLLAGDCSICLTTLPTALGHRPEANVLWLDAHGDFNTPDTTPSQFLGGMALAGACRQWDPGIGDGIKADRVVLAGVRELDPEERALLERSEATVIGASTVETLVGVKNALDGAPVYVHLDADVLDPEALPPEKLYDVLEAVAEDSPPVGLEVTGAGEGATETVVRVLEPLLDAIPQGAAHVDG